MIASAAWMPQRGLGLSSAAVTFMRFGSWRQEIGPVQNALNVVPHRMAAARKKKSIHRCAARQATDACAHTLNPHRFTSVPRRRRRPAPSASQLKRERGRGGRERVRQTANVALLSPGDEGGLATFALSRVRGASRPPRVLAASRCVRQLRIAKWRIGLPIVLDVCQPMDAPPPTNTICTAIVSKVQGPLLAELPHPRKRSS